MFVCLFVCYCLLNPHSSTDGKSQKILEFSSGAWLENRCAFFLLFLPSFWGVFFLNLNHTLSGLVRVNELSYVDSYEVSAVHFQGHTDSSVSLC